MWGVLKAVPFVDSNILRRAATALVKLTIHIMG